VSVVSKDSNAHRMQLPGQVLIGSNVITHLGEVAGLVVSSRRAVLITDKDVLNVAGKPAVAALKDNKFDVEVFTITAATEATVDQARQVIRKQKAGLVIGCGGGSVIDIAKLSSAREGQPFISVPTVASHDGLSSPRASIKHEDSSVSIEGQSPIAIVADTHIVAQAPFRFMAAGCGDLIAKFTAVRDWKLAHTLGYEYYGDYAASLALMSANIVMQHASTIKPNSEESARTVLEALIASGIAMGIAGSSRPGSGAEHKFSHALDRIAPKPALHGEQCGVGTIMMAYLHGIPWEDKRDALAVIGAPTTAKQLGIEDRYIIQALKEAHTINPERYTILGDRGMTEQAAERLARITSVIS
jgi:glycerol-1-phosphate dehydrogenase [NAD(P)+]